MIPIYEKTFNSGFWAIWGNTQFRNEIPLLSLYRATTCWIHHSDVGIEDRRKLVKNFLASWFPTQKETDLLNRVDTNLSTDTTMISRIAKNVCSIYRKPPTRKYENLSESEVEYLETIISSSKLNMHLNEAFILAWLAGESLVRPRQIRGKWTIEVIPRDMYRYIETEEGKLQEVWIAAQKVVGNTIENYFHVWTPETYTQRDIAGEVVTFEYQNEKVKEVRHGYTNEKGEPIVPFVKVKLETNDDIYGGCQWELVREQLNLCLVDYLIQENLVYGSTGFWFAKNIADIAKSTQISLSPAKLIHVSTGSIDDPEPEIEHKSATFLANELLAFRKEYEATILRRYGIPTSMISDNPGLPSGVAMLIDRIELEEYRESFTQIARFVDEEVIRTIIAVNNAELPRKLSFTKVSVDYPEFTPFYETEKEIEIADMLFERGLISPKVYLEKLAKIDYISTDEQALEYISKNKEYYNAIRNITSNTEYANSITGTGEDTTID